MSRTVLFLSCQLCGVACTVSLARCHLHGVAGAASDPWKRSLNLGFLKSWRLLGASRKDWTDEFSRRRQQPHAGDEDSTLVITE